MGNVKLKGSLFEILGAERRVRSALSTLDFRTAEGFSKNLLGSAGDRALVGRERTGRHSRISSSRTMHPCKEETRKDCQEVSMDEQGAPGQTGSSVRVKAPWEGHRVF